MSRPGRRSARSATTSEAAGGRTGWSAWSLSSAVRSTPRRSSLQVSGAITSDVVVLAAAVRDTEAVTTIDVQAPAFGSLMREWRQRRRLSQLDLAIEADV